MGSFSLNEVYSEYIVFFNTVCPYGSFGDHTPEEFDEDGLIKAKENRQN